MYNDGSVNTYQPMNEKTNTTNLKSESSLVVESQIINNNRMHCND